MRIVVDDLRSTEVQALLREHLADMAAQSPPESMHALDLDALGAPEVTFWTVRNCTGLCGCGALKELDPTHGEIKSMRTTQNHLRQGVAKTLLVHIVAEAKRRNYKRLSLETGTPARFAAARILYETHGFEVCSPFGDYVEDPFSVCMTLKF